MSGVAMETEPGGGETPPVRLRKGKSELYRPDPGSATGRDSGECLDGRRGVAVELPATGPGPSPAQPHFTPAGRWRESAGCPPPLPWRGWRGLCAGAGG